MVGRLSTALMAATMVFTGAWVTVDYTLIIFDPACSINTQCYADDGLGNLTGACVQDQSIPGHSCAARFGSQYTLFGGHCHAPSVPAECVCVCIKE